MHRLQPPWQRRLEAYLAQVAFYVYLVARTNAKNLPEKKPEDFNIKWQVDGLRKRKMTDKEIENACRNIAKLYNGKH